jgi:hypothetical protein
VYDKMPMDGADQKIVDAVMKGSRGPPSPEKPFQIPTKISVLTAEEETVASLYRKI